MTTFNTGNPIGSTAVKDLYDNAENLDYATNDRASRSWPDRFGIPRRTWWGMEQDFQDFLIQSGFVDLGEYGPGIEITARNQVFRRDDQYWRAGPNLDLPYTTTGNWSEEGEFFLISTDTTLRDELADGSDANYGSSLVAFLQKGDDALPRTVLEKLRDSVSVKDFGAVGDGIADDTESIQNALDSSDSVFFPSGVYLISEALNITRRGQYIYGYSYKTTIVQSSSETDIFLLPNQISEVRLKNFLLRGATGATFLTSGYGIRTEYSGNLLMQDVVVVDMFGGFYVDTRTFVSTSDIWLDKCKAFSCDGPAFNINNGTQIYLSKCDALSCGYGFYIQSGSAFHATDCLILSPQIAGVNMSTIDWVFMSSVEVDNSGGRGWLLNQVKGCHLVNCWSGSSAASGFELTGCEEFYVSNTTSRLNGAHGWNIAGLNGGFFSNCASNDNDALGSDNSGFIFLTGVNNVNLIGCDASNVRTTRQGYGFRLLGTAANVRVIGGRAQGNTISQYANSSSGVGNVSQNIIGYVSRNKGISTIPSGSGTVVVNHGLGAIPNNVQIQATSDYTSNRFWVTSVNASTFTVASNANFSSAFQFYWSAEVAGNQ